MITRGPRFEAKQPERKAKASCLYLDMVAKTQQGGKTTKASKHKVDDTELPDTAPVEAEQQARKRRKKAAAKSDTVEPEQNGSGHPAVAVKQNAAAAASEGQPAAKKAKRDNQTDAAPGNSAADALPIGEAAAGKQGKKRKRSVLPPSEQWQGFASNLASTRGPRLLSCDSAHDSYWCRKATLKADPDKDLPEEERVRRKNQRELRVSSYSICIMYGSVWQLLL